MGASFASLAHPLLFAQSPHPYGAMHHEPPFKNHVKVNLYSSEKQPTHDSGWRVPGGNWG